MTRKSSLLAATALGLLPLPALAGEIVFAPVAFAETDAQKRDVLAAETAMVDGAEVKLGYHILARTGDALGSGTFGALTDATGAQLADAPLSAAADFTSLIPANGKLYAVTHFESAPGAMYLTELAQDATGMLKAVATKAIDFAAYGGLWIPCAGSVTPWGTHLGSEEYPSDARAYEAAARIDDIDEDSQGMARYMGLDPATMTLDAFKAAFRPYRYGYATEITITEAGEGRAAKHFAMGRISVELAKVMPDGKTAYISDDGTNVGLFRFVADTEGDLSAGTLYAAKWTQTSGEGAGAADISWVELGHATDAEVRELIEGGISFSDIFETAKIADDGTCPEGFAGSNANGQAECLKVKPGMELAASRLETRRYASMLGATTEFRKMEGIALDAEGAKLYLSMSEIGKAMEAGSKGDKGGRDDIQLAANPCGAVYELNLGADWTATAMKAAVVGMPKEYAAGTMGEGNACDIDGIANPDNITFIPGYDTLVIGEDTGEGHQNDAVWAYDRTKATLTRILSTPYGAETTSVYWYGDVGGHGYLMAVVQHPYGESDKDKLQDPEQARAYVGYIGPFPGMAVTN